MSYVINTIRADRMRVLRFSLAALAGLAIPASLIASAKAPRVLFICQFGSVKSAIARELLKRWTAERGVKVIVSSRGITPEPHLHPSVRDQLRAEGVDPEREPLKKLVRADLKSADIVIIFNRLPSAMRSADVRDWTVVPSINDNYLDARADLDRRIDNLIDEIASAGR